MAKRLPADEKEFRPVAAGLERAQLSRAKSEPVDANLVRSVIAGSVARAAPQSEPEDAPPAIRFEPQPPATAAGNGVGEGASSTSAENVVQLPAQRTERTQRRERDEDERPEKISRSMERAIYQMRFKCTLTERDDVNELVRRHAREAGTALSFSHIMRAWVNILRHAEPDILRALKKAGLRRPPNEDPIGLADYERDLAVVYLEALRRTQRMRPE